MRILATAIIAAMIPVQASRAEDASPRSWGETLGGVAYDAGRGVNRMLSWSGLPNGLKPEDGGAAIPARPSPTPPGPVSTTTLELRTVSPESVPTWNDTFYSWGLGAARGADLAYGSVLGAKDAAVPYAFRAWDVTRDAGSSTWNGTVAGVDAASPYAGAAWDATRRMAATGYGAASDGVRTGIKNMPAMIDWSADLAASGATAFVSVGGATLVCGLVVSPLAAVSAGAAYVACMPVTALGGYAGNQALRHVYGLYGRAPSESAFFAGNLLGGLAGNILGHQAVTSLARQSLQSQYGDFRAYSKAARALTARNVRAWDPNVAAKRAQGFHVDHVQSLKCGWTHGVSVAAIAGARNFQYLPARENLSLGAKGC